MEFPIEGTKDETELETRLWPAVEKSEMAGEAGAEVLMDNGEGRCDSNASNESRASTI